LTEKLKKIVAAIIFVIAQGIEVCGMAPGDRGFSLQPASR